MNRNGKKFFLDQSPVGGVALSGALSLAAEKPLLDALFAGGGVKPLDLSGVIRIDGPGMGILVRAAYRAKATGKTLEISATKEVYGLFGMAGLGKIASLSVSGDGVGFVFSEWAKTLGPVEASEMPEWRGPNVLGRRAAGPMDGFGKLWQKRYWVRLDPEKTDVLGVAEFFRTRLPGFWPEGNVITFKTPGVVPGAVGPIKLKLPGGGRLFTGVRVLHADEESVTFATLAGHMASGWISFMGTEIDGAPAAMVMSLARTADPLFDVGFHLFGHREQEKFWRDVLGGIAREFGTAPEVKMEKECADDSVRPSAVSNTRWNAGFSSALKDLGRLVGLSD